MSDFEVAYLPFVSPDPKYSGLRLLLDAATDDFITLSFAEIEAAIGSDLPASARRYPAWWSNSGSHVQAGAWMDAGWRTTNLVLAQQRVSFTRLVSTGLGSPRRAVSTRQTTTQDGSSSGTVVPRMIPVPDDRPNRVGLVGCVKQKLDCAAPAADLYISPLFRGRRAYVEQSCGRWLIISALHGVVRPEAVIEPYDVTLIKAPRSERRAWADRVLRQLDSELGSWVGRTLEIHAGAEYVDYGLAAGLRERGAKVERPARGLKLGEQRSFYKSVVFASSDASQAKPSTAATTDGAPPVTGGGAPEWEERDAWAAIAALDESPALVRACDWPGNLSCLERPGLYAWWVDEAGARDLAGGLDVDIPSGRIYVGQSGATFWPSGKLSDNTLGKRIGQMHLDGRVRGSTFRWTLAAALFDRLDVQVRAPMVITSASERALSEWMRAHLSIAVQPHDDRDSLEGLERQMLGLLDPPLNLRHMEPNPLRARLTHLRRRISRDQ